MPKFISKKQKNMAENQIIYGLHAVKAALINEKRTHEELCIHENHRKIGETYRSKVKKISYLKQRDFKKLCLSGLGLILLVSLKIEYNSFI